MGSPITETITMTPATIEKHRAGLGDVNDITLNSNALSIDYMRLAIRDQEITDKEVKLYPFGGSGDYNSYINARPLFAQIFGSDFINPVTESTAHATIPNVKDIPRAVGETRNVARYRVAVAANDEALVPLVTDLFSYRRSIDTPIHVEQSETGNIISSLDSYDNQNYSDGTGGRNIAKRMVFAGQYIPVMFFSGLEDLNEDILCSIDFPETNAVNVQPTYGALYSFWALAQTGKTVRIENNLELGSEFKISLTYYNRHCPRKKILYWWTRGGGWDWYIFNDVEGTRKAEKKVYKLRTDNFGAYKNEVKSTNAFSEVKMYGVPATREYCGHLRGIIESPHVIDETGAAVQVLNESLLFDDDGILEPVVSVRYKDERTINL